MFLKNLTIVLVLFAVVQGLPSKFSNEKTDNPLYEEIRALVERLGKNVSELSHRSNDIMTGLKQFNEYALELKTDWNDIAGKEVAALHVVIFESNRTANEQGVDISSCIGEVFAAVDPMLTESANLIYDSVEQFQNKYLDKWLFVSGQTTQIHGALDRYLLEAWNCDNDGCLEEILKTVQDKLQTYIEGELVQFIDEAVEEIEPEGGNVLTGGYQQIDTCVEGVQQGRDDFIECFKALMGN